MRLDDFDPNINVGDQRGSGGGFGGGGGGGGGLLLGLLPLVGSRFGCGGIVLVLIVFAVFGGLGNIFSGGGGVQRSAPTHQVRRGRSVRSGWPGYGRPAGTTPESGAGAVVPVAAAALSASACAAWSAACRSACSCSAER